MNKLWPGDIFLTRNLGITEDQNESPGYFNHGAIYTGDGIIIESQTNYGVIQVSLDNFWQRYPIIVILRSINNVGANAADFAKKLVGLPYRKISSIFLFQRRPIRGINCVSVIRLAYTEANGYDPKWKFPDDIFYDTNLIEVDRKFNKNWNGQFIIEELKHDRNTKI